MPRAPWLCTHGLCDLGLLASPLWASPSVKWGFTGGWLGGLYEVLRIVLNTWCKFSLYWVSGVVVLMVPVLLLVELEMCLRVKCMVWRVSEVGALVHYRDVFTKPLPCAGCGGEQAGLQLLRSRRGPRFGQT